MKVLVIEDVPEVVATVGVCFRIRWPGASVISTDRGEEAPGLVETETPDIIILDLGLPDMDGLEVLREIRRFSELPVIIITGNGDETAKVIGLEMGADDYIVKPFAHTELMARAKAVLRRTHMPQLRGDMGVASGGGLNIDLSGRSLSVEGDEVSLTPTEWRLLSHLVRNQGKVVVHQVLAEKVWGTCFTDRAAIKMCVRRLRVKIGDASRIPAIIRTHRGIGYSFAMPS